MLATKYRSGSETLTQIYYIKENFSIIVIIVINAGFEMKPFKFIDITAFVVY